MADAYSYMQEAPDRYTFLSTGRQGEIKKVVTLEAMATNLYNILLQDEIHGALSDDITVTDNGDALKVVNTVTVIVKEVLDLYPDYTIHIAGSDKRRNRMYQRRMLRELNNEVYRLLGSVEAGGDFVPLQEGVEYMAFLAFRK